jgi:hypothetical protein
VGLERRADLVAVLIAQRDAGAQQVGAGLAAAQIGSMTARAVRLVKALAADDDILRRELARELGEAPGPAAAPLPSATRPRPASRITAALFGGGLTRRRLTLRRRRRRRLLRQRQS